MADEKDKNNQDNQNDDPLAPGGRLSPERLKAQHGNAEAALQSLAFKCNQLEADNANYRKEIRDLKSKLPKDDSIVLEGDEKKEYEQFKTLGKFSDVKQKLDDGVKASEALATYEREAQMREAAKVAGINFDVLKLAPKASELTYKVVKNDDGTKVLVQYKDGDKEVEKPIREYADEHWKPLGPALYENGSNDEVEEQKFVIQSPSGRAGERTVKVDEIDAEIEERLNGLGF